MRSALLLAHLSLWLAFADAFFPWFPDYRCEKDETCHAKRASIDSRSNPSPDALETTRQWRPSPLPRGPRIPFVNTVSDRAAREAQRLAHKYRSRSTAANDASIVEKRSKNQYKVIEPTQSAHRNGAGIYQDGSDFSYFVKAKLGSKQKEMYMLVDTGASTSWVMGSDCESSACSRHNSFGKDDSTTLKVGAETFSVSYGTGSVKGNKVEDTISFAGLSPSLVFGLASDTSNDFNHFPFDGILGLSLASGSTDNFMKKIIESGQIDKNIFCVFINRNSDGPNTGEIAFGECNKDKYTGDFTYTGVKSTNGDWAIPMDSLTYDGKKTGVQGKLAYIDTGTTYVFGPRTDVESFHKNIPGASTVDGTTWTVPCDSNKEVSYEFSGTRFTIAPKDWLSKPDADGVCTSNIYGHEVVPNAWLLGDLFLKNVYAVFDADEKRVGFAARASSPGPSTPSDGGEKGQDKNKDDNGKGKEQDEKNNDDDKDDGKFSAADSKTTSSEVATSTKAVENSSTPSGTTRSAQQSTTLPTQQSTLPSVQESAISQSVPAIPYPRPSEDSSAQEPEPETSPTQEENPEETDEPSSGQRLRSYKVLSVGISIIACLILY